MGGRSLVVSSVLLVAVLSATASTAAQDTSGSAQPPDPADGSLHGAPRTEGVAQGPPTLASIGLSGGFPSYQTVAPTFSVQSGHFGVQAKVGLTAAGPYVGLQLRGYPPLPVPLPVFLAAGAGFYGGEVSYHGAVGAHVPLGLNLRLDLEGGVASVPLLGERALAPHAALGVSYAFAVDTASGNGFGGGAARRPTCAEPTEPSPADLGPAVDRTVAEWVRSAQATYGSVYTDLDYGYRIVDTSLTGTDAVVVVEYSGSVREIGTGVTHSATGEATATFAWTGCAWSNTGVSY